MESNFNAFSTFEHWSSNTPGLPRWSKRVLCRLYSFAELNLGVEISYRGSTRKGTRMYDVTCWNYRPRLNHFWFDYAGMCTAITTCEAKAVWMVATHVISVRLIRNAAATRIQKHFRGWQTRMKVAWDVNSAVGRGLEMLRIRAEMRLDRLTLSACLPERSKAAGVVSGHGPVRKAVA